ncbi:Uncharacterized protein HZ326_10391 [Fusarium oxysporum f. sp. albedinis]|nr:Uncharacterized protein HZ326_10391 [Fusarium oxysporum f. sp. albedinis]
MDCYFLPLNELSPALTRYVQSQIYYGPFPPKSSPRLKTTTFHRNRSLTRLFILTQALLSNLLSFARRYTSAHTAARRDYASI